MINWYYQFIARLCSVCVIDNVYTYILHWSCTPSTRLIRLSRVTRPDDNTNLYLQRISMAEEEKSGEVELPVLHDGEKYHVFIIHDQDDQHDQALAFAITEELEQYGFKVCFRKRDFEPCERVLESIEEAISKSHWTVAILSKSFLESGLCEHETLQAKIKGVESDRVLFIPVLYGVTEEDVPTKFRSFTSIDYNDKCFYKKLRTALTREASLSSAVPAGNVSHGLAWSYFYGFLNLVLPGLKERIKDSPLWSGYQTRSLIKRLAWSSYYGLLNLINPGVKDAVMKSDAWAGARDRFCQKMLIIMPTDCYCPGSLDKVDPAFRFEGYIPYNATRAGNIKWDYKSSVYSVTDKNDGKKYYCICEFATPLLSMYEMEKGQIAGLSKQQKTHQMKLFVEKLNEILDHPNNRACHNTTIIREYQTTLNPDYMKKEHDTSGDSLSLYQLVLQAVKSDLQDQRENAARQ